MFLGQLISELKLEKTSHNSESSTATKLLAFTLHTDSMSAKMLAENEVVSQRTKHMDIRYHFLRDLISKNILTLKFVPTSEQPADMLTKPLTSSTLTKFRAFCLETTTENET